MGSYWVRSRVPSFVFNKSVASVPSKSVSSWRSAVSSSTKPARPWDCQLPTATGGNGFVLGSASGHRPLFSVSQWLRSCQKPFCLASLTPRPALFRPYSHQTIFIKWLRLASSPTSPCPDLFLESRISNLQSSVRRRAPLEQSHFPFTLRPLFPSPEDWLFLGYHIGGKNQAKVEARRSWDGV